MRKQFLDLGKQPIANGFLHKEDIKNLRQVEITLNY